MTKKIRVGLLFGGRSGEHEVSITSAASVLKALDRERYEVIPIAITRKGRWLAGPPAAGLLAQPQNLLRMVVRKGKPVTPAVDPTQPRLIALDQVPLTANPSVYPQTEEKKLDIVFPVLHGTFGEDGTVQGLFELSGIPYVGAGVLASAVGMDKDVMKRLFRDARLPVVKWVRVMKEEWGKKSAAVAKLVAREIGYPIFVKPANLGSSVGITKVRKAQKLAEAMDLASEFDRKILVEKAVDAREIECSVLGNDFPKASLPGEVVPVNEFYDYEAKYTKPGSDLIIPAKLEHRKIQRIQQLALRAFKIIDCAGMARVDFLLDRKSGRIFINEINTIPGFTPISMYPKLWEASGLTYPQLLDTLIELALERYREKAHTRYTYEPKS